MPPAVVTRGGVEPPTFRFQLATGQTREARTDHFRTIPCGSIGRAAWARFSGDTDFKVLRCERVGGFEVLTAWLGTDQVSALDGGPPSAFGTITYEHAAGVLDSSTEQFSATAELAMVTHAAAVARLRGR